jgi:hypothetical protein
VNSKKEHESKRKMPKMIKIGRMGEQVREGATQKEE